MTKYRRLDANGDMTFGRGAESFAQGVEAVRQAIETRLRLLRGEWWERPADGLLHVCFPPQLGGKHRPLYPHVPTIPSPKVREREPTPPQPVYFAILPRYRPRWAPAHRRPLPCRMTKYAG